jgi:hypothetical protein
MRGRREPGGEVPPKTRKCLGMRAYVDMRVRKRLRIAWLHVKWFNQ